MDERIGLLRSISGGALILIVVITLAGGFGVTQTVCWDAKTVAGAAVMLAGAVCAFLPERVMKSKWPGLLLCAAGALMVLW